MPKLRKHSQLKLHKDVSEETDSGNEGYDIDSEDCSLSANLVKPQKMKLSSRLKLLQDPRQKQSGKKTQKRLANQHKDPLNSKDSNQVQSYFNKFTDDDIDSSSCQQYLPKEKQAKPKKKQIKTKNKLFSDFNFDEKQNANLKVQQQVSEPLELQLQLAKRQKRESCLLEKFDQKACIFKKKLEYKELHKDHRYKRDMQQKLKSIEQAQYVNIVIEVPKVFGGKDAHLDAALFLKNKKQHQSTQQRTDESRKQVQDESIVLKDRKQYYEDLGKQIKLKKAETIAQHVLKECFKKSKLQDMDFIPDLDFNQSNRQHTYQQISQISKPKPIQNFKKTHSFQDSNFSRNSLQLQKKNKNVQKDKVFNQVHKEQQTSIAIKQSWESKQNGKIKQLQQEDLNKENKNQQSQPINQVKYNPIKRKLKKDKAPTKPLNKKDFRFMKYIQVEAQISSDEQQGGPKHKDADDEQSNDDDDTQVSSLIDDDAQVDSNDRHLIHRKFVSDMIEKQQKQYNQMKQKMQKKYLQEEENLRKRMKQAALRNKQKQNLEDAVFIEHELELNQDSKAKSTSNEISSDLKNEAKLKQLEQRLQANKKEIKEKTVLKPEIPNKIINLKEIQISVFEQKNNGLKKATRNGLQSIAVKKKGKSLPKK